LGAADLAHTRERTFITRPSIRYHPFMRIIRFLGDDGQIHLGQSIDAAAALEIEGDLRGEYRVTARQLNVAKLLAPIVPTDILCIGLNYREHAKESGSEPPAHPMLFIKASNSLNNPFDPVPIPRLSASIDFEGELAIVIARDCKNVSRERALEHVLGYTVANDVSARDWQRDKNLGGGQFSRGKSFDGFCPLGPCIVTADQIPNPNALRLITTLNGQIMQDSSTADMIFDVPALIQSLSSTLTIRAGAVILTGTPHGVGMGRKPPVWMKAGDTIAIEIEGIGRLENPVSPER
jgi:2-keto-4-pentenoate hydratase/2-oxohepta-3-ene-1,7-dioic acid hydratase in catechol pathway